jgi:hypothetical protein
MICTVPSDDRITVGCFGRAALRGKSAISGVLRLRVRTANRGLMGALALGFALLSLSRSWNLAAQTRSQPFPRYLTDKFDYASFTRFDAPVPPKDLIYQSNGFMALREHGFGGQIVIVPIAGDGPPENSSDRLPAVEIDAPIFTDDSGKTYDFAESPAQRHLTYYADRTVYRAVFVVDKDTGTGEAGPEVTLTVYPVYGKSVCVIQMRIEKASGTQTVTLRTRGTGFQLLSNPTDPTTRYGSPRLPYRLSLGSRPKSDMHEGNFEWRLSPGGDAAVVLALGETEEKAAALEKEIIASSDLFDQATHRAWNDYLASAPLVAPAVPIHFTIGTSGENQTITPEELVRSELWFWRGVLTTTCQVPYLPNTPITIADWNVFMGMWGNDGIAEAIALSDTARKDLARGAILNWFRYSVNARGDGTAAWTVFPSGKNTFQAKGRERNTQSVPVQASLVGQYVRLTGDKAILDEKPGGAAGDRTLWQALVAYQKNLLAVRDSNHDHLIDWLHTYETGWDDKNSSFIDLKGTPTSAINEQVFNLWSLEEMAYLARLRGEDPRSWEEEFTLAKDAVRNKLWDQLTQRYWDLNASDGTLWTKGENLDAYYLLYYESDRARVVAMMRRLNDPAKFNGALLPTMAFDTPKWGGYWRGPAWPRIFSYVALALDRAGQHAEAFNWLARAIQSNLGPLLPENVDPKAYPPAEHAIGSVRIMGYDALDTMVFPDIAGLRVWAGQDLTVVSHPGAGRVYVREQKWMGDSYDALLEPGQPTRIWRNGHELKPLPSNQTWRATRHGDRICFEPTPEINSRPNMRCF